MRCFTRLSLGFSKKLENLAAATALHFVYFNFVWRPRSSDDSGKAGRFRVTPAMAAKVTPDVLVRNLVALGLKNATVGRREPSFLTDFEARPNAEGDHDQRSRDHSEQEDHVKNRAGE